MFQSELEKGALERQILELKRQLLDQEDFGSSNRKRERLSGSLSQDFSIGDISVDNPDVSFSNVGEVIGDTLRLDLERSLEK